MDILLEFDLRISVCAKTSALSNESAFTLDAKIPEVVKYSLE
jgi:hypothetical protein